MGLHYASFRKWLRFLQVVLIVNSHQIAQCGNDFTIRCTYELLHCPEFLSPQERPLVLVLDFWLVSWVLGPGLGHRRPRFLFPVPSLSLSLSGTKLAPYLLQR